MKPLSSYWFWWSSFAQICAKVQSTNPDLEKTTLDESENWVTRGYSVDDDILYCFIWQVRYDEEERTLTAICSISMAAPNVLSMLSGVQITFEPRYRILNVLTLKRNKNVMSVMTGEVGIYSRPKVDNGYIQSIVNIWKIFYFQRKQARRKIQRWYKDRLYQPGGVMYMKTMSDFNNLIKPTVT